MARLLSSTILIQAESSSAAPTTSIRLYYGNEVNESKRILSTSSLTVQDLLNPGICIPGNTVPGSEDTITVFFEGTCQTVFPIAIERIEEPIVTPTPTPTPTPLPGIPTPIPTLTPTPTPTPTIIGQTFGENSLSLPSNQGDGYLIWQGNNYTNTVNAQTFIQEICNTLAPINENTFYPIPSQQGVTIYENIEPNYNLIGSMYLPGSSASLIKDNVSNQVLVRISNVRGIRDDEFGSIVRSSESRYVFNI